MERDNAMELTSDNVLSEYITSLFTFDREVIDTKFRQFILVKE